MTPSALRLYGRSGSHYTRVARIFAHEAEVDVDFAPVSLLSTDPAAYGGHPALKLPLLQIGGEQLFGTENICRHVVGLSPRHLNVVWPEHGLSTRARNAQELVWHAMQAQVQLVLGLEIAGLAPENVYFAKALLGLDGALAWLDAAIAEVFDELPPTDLSLLEVTLFCLIEHLSFRPTIEVAGRANLVAFCDRFKERASAQATPYVV